MKKIQLILGVVLAGVGLFVSVNQADAAMLKSVQLDMSDSRTGTAGVDHAYTFTTVGTTLGKITFQYCSEPSGTCTRPANTDFSALTITESTTGLTDADWTVSSTGQDTVMIRHVNGTAETVNANDVLTITFSNVTNPAITDCSNLGAGNSTDTCYVRISTYSSPGSSSAVDTGITSLTVTTGVAVSARVDPTFTFSVEGVAQGNSDGGIATSEASAFNTLTFGSLTPGTPKYMAQKLTVTTNTDNGYSVTARVNSNLTGVYGNDIDPFSGNSATWTAPKAWLEPTGTNAGTDTGWFGAYTSDNDISGWTTAATVFGPISTTENTVSYSTNSADADVVYVTYALEVNNYQPADTYTGTVRYNALPTY